MARCHPRSYLIESSVRWPRRFFENEEDSGGKKKKRSASASLISLMAEEEGDVCGFPRWLATVQTDATIR